MLVLIVTCSSLLLAVGMRSAHPGQVAIDVASVSIAAEHHTVNRTGSASGMLGSASGSPSGMYPSMGSAAGMAPPMSSAPGHGPTPAPVRSSVEKQAANGTRHNGSAFVNPKQVPVWHDGQSLAHLNQTQAQSELSLTRSGGPKTQRALRLFGLFAFMGYCFTVVSVVTFLHRPNSKLGPASVFCAMCCCPAGLLALLLPIDQPKLGDAVLVTAPQVTFPPPKCDPPPQQ